MAAHSRRSLAWTRAALPLQLHKKGSEERHTRFKREAQENCCFCKEDPERAVHLFRRCPRVRRFWRNICSFICDGISAEFVLFWRNLVS